MIPRTLMVMVLLALASTASASTMLTTPWILNPDNGHYYALTTQSSWVASEVVAIANSGLLATIRNQLEQNFVYQTFQNYGNQQRLLWIGLNDYQVEGQFHWSSGEPVTYTNWYPGEPNNSGGENYVNIYPASTGMGGWNDYGHLRNAFGLPAYGVVEYDPANPVQYPIHISTSVDWLVRAPEGNLVGQDLDTVGLGFEAANPDWNTSLTFNTTNWSPATQVYSDAAPIYIWGERHQSPVYFRHTFTLDGPFSNAVMLATVDDNTRIYINGQEVVSDPLGGSSGFGPLDVTTYLHAGENLIAVKAQDIGVTASLSIDIYAVSEPSSFMLSMSSVWVFALLGVSSRRRSVQCGWSRRAVPPCGDYVSPPPALRARPLIRIAVASLFGLFVVASAKAVVISTVPVGNGGNAPDTAVMVTDGSTGYGAVAYSYAIGATEVTVGQYAAFLNAVAKTDAFGLYNPGMGSVGLGRSGSPGSYSYLVSGSVNLPVTYVDWGDCARFANWLHNGQPVGIQDANTTEDGSYSLNGATSVEALNAVTRNVGASWVIPSENEWYKAAYHKSDGVTGNYWNHATGTDIEPVAAPPPGGTNSANYGGNSVVGHVTIAGAYVESPSPYGTFDQGGNLWEWNETLTSIATRGQRGGSYSSLASLRISSQLRLISEPTVDAAILGFRVAKVATIPEPSACALGTLGLAALLLSHRLKRSWANRSLS